MSPNSSTPAEPHGDQDPAAVTIGQVIDALDADPADMPPAVAAAIKQFEQSPAAAVLRQAGEKMLASHSGLFELSDRLAEQHRRHEAQVEEILESLPEPFPPPASAEQMAAILEEVLAKQQAFDLELEQQRKRELALESKRAAKWWNGPVASLIILLLAVAGFVLALIAWLFPQNPG